MGSPVLSFKHSCNFTRAWEVGGMAAGVKHMPVGTCIIVEVGPTKDHSRVDDDDDDADGDDDADDDDDDDDDDGD